MALIPVYDMTLTLKDPNVIEVVLAEDTKGIGKITSIDEAFGAGSPLAMQANAIGKAQGTIQMDPADSKALLDALNNLPSAPPTISVKGVTLGTECSCGHDYGDHEMDTDACLECACPEFRP